MMNEWIREPDKAEWEHEGFPCLVLRMTSMGHLCGYIGVPEGHPWFEQDYDTIRNIDGDWVDVHGGLTFASHGDLKFDKATHSADGKKLWWIGFDCAHSGDLIPHGHHFGGETYKNMAYVRNQTNLLALQASAVSEAHEARR